MGDLISGFPESAKKNHNIPMFIILVIEQPKSPVVIIWHERGTGPASGPANHI